MNGLTTLLRLTIQLPYWLLLKPSGWHQFVQQIDGRLPPRFCLAELDTQTLRQRPLHHLFLAIWVIWPLLLLLLTYWLIAPPPPSTNQSITDWLATLTMRYLAFSVVTAILVNLFFSLTISVIGGFAIGVAMQLGLALSINRMGLVLFEFNEQPLLGLIFGGVMGFFFYVDTTIATTEHGRRLTVLQQVSNGMAGFLAGTAVLAVAALSVAIIIPFWQQSRITGPLIGLFFGIVQIGYVSVVIGRRTGNWQRTLLISTTTGLVVGGLMLLRFAPLTLGGPIYGIDLIITVLSVLLVSFTVFFIPPYVFAERLAGAWAGGMAGIVAGMGLLFGYQYNFKWFNIWPNFIYALAIILVIITMRWWRPILFYPLANTFNTILYRLDQELKPQRSFIRWHAAFWDELQYLRFGDFDNHLIYVYETNAHLGQALFEALIPTPHRWAVAAAQIELEARQLETRTDIADIAQAHSQLDRELPDHALAQATLQSLSRISHNVQAALAQASSYNQRLILNNVADRLDLLQRDLVQSSEEHGRRFLPIVANWQKIILSHIYSLEQQSELNNEIIDPYVIGVPLDMDQGTFVGRQEITQQIENLLRDQLHPPLLLYGQRRMGKTSLLNNLTRLLPDIILPLFADLQGPLSFASTHTSLLYQLSYSMRRSAQQKQLQLPPLPKQALEPDPFAIFEEWLDQVIIVAQADGFRNILLCLDEFEALDEAFTKGRLDDAAVLGTLRHILQHKTQIKLLLSGSHTLKEFRRWSSYFINAQILHISYLAPDEARQLIEHPIQNFPLTYNSQATESILQLTHCHPFLVQLLCSELIAYKNSQPIAQRTHVLPHEVAEIIPRVLTRGSMFFTDIENNQLSPSARLACYQLAQHGTLGDYAQQAEVVALLEEREVIEQRGGEYIFQIELIRRWFLSGAKA